MISIHFQGKPFNITIIQVYASITYAKESEGERFYEDLQDIPQPTPKKTCPFHHWNAKVGSQETPGVTGKFGLELQNEAGQRLTVLPREQTSFSNNTREDSTHGHHQMVNAKIRLITFFAAEVGEALYS